jgi:predicted negative regulator of RcsB-dependent stress response
MSVVPPPRRERRRRRRSKVLLIVTVVALAVTIGCGGAALVVRNDTSELQARAEPFDRQVRELIASEHNAEHRLRTLQSRSRATATALAALLGAAQAQVEASNHAVDVANQAVDQYNNGQTDVAAAFQAAGDAAIGDLEARTTAVHDALRAARRAITRLQASGG